MNAPVLLPLKARVPSRTEQLRFLGFAHEIEESGPPRLASAMIYTVAGLLVASVAWAALTPVHQIAVAPGQIVPSGSISAVQHLEGGIVGKVLVHDGSSVAAGEPILEFDGAAALSELKALRSRQAALAVQHQRLTAFIHGGALRGSIDDDGGAPGLAGVQTTILQAQRQTKEQQKAILERQLAAKRGEQTTLQEQIVFARRQSALAVQEREARRDLFEKGLTTRSSYLEAQRADNRAQSDLAELLGQSKRSDEAVLESEARLRELDARLASEAELEIGQVSAELLQVKETLSKLQDRAERLVLRAPIAGRVKDLKARTVGSVVAPGMVVAEIVPQEQRLLVEARLSPRDIGHAKVGQPVSVKVESYAFSTYGAVPGRLDRIAASTTADADGAVYYKAVIELERGYAGYEPNVHALRSGMTVQADIVTGERSVLQHLVAPVHTALASAFRER